MPSLVTSPRPALDAARYHTQVEFDRTYRSIQNAPEYKGKNLLFVAGLNIDVSPPPGMPFPLTKFTLPWAAYAQLLATAPRCCSNKMRSSKRWSRNPARMPTRMSFDAAISAMAQAEGVRVPE